jgi:predicted metal-dependent hydrolase
VIPDDGYGRLLDAEEAAMLRRGAEAFNCGKFFECHEILEEIWRGCRNPARDLLQGLIQVAVGFYHVRNGNLLGGESQLGKGLEKLEKFGESYAGIELAHLRDGIRAWIEKIRRNEQLAGELPQYTVTGEKQAPDREERG